jgi:hypothetical protein
MKRLNIIKMTLLIQLICRLNRIYTVSIWPRNSWYRYILKRNENICPNKNLYTNVQNSMIHNSLNIETTQISIKNYEIQETLRNNKVNIWNSPVIIIIICKKIHNLRQCVFKFVYPPPASMLSNDLFFSL